ncbi:MAG: GTPase [Campylobacterota bacterium]|nr:GTPase [Campylobacterota bacterium]
MSRFKDATFSLKAKEKYISKDELDSIKVLKKAIKKSSVLVTCMGLYNHGKSSLLNTLVKDFQHETFKTADVRETAENKKVVYEDITFVDTPGLNAKDYDNKRVMDAVKESDINLLVHNISTGEFTKVEVEFLQNIKKHWKNPKEFIERTIFVLSRTDTASEEDLKTTKKRMQHQIKEIFGSSATFVGVSAKSYTKGMLEKKKLLVKKSNVDELQNILIGLKNSYKSLIVKTKKERLERIYDNLINNLSSKIQINKLEVSQLTRELDKIENSFNADVRNIQSTLSNHYARL